MIRRMLVLLLLVAGLHAWHDWQCFKERLGPLLEPLRDWIESRETHLGPQPESSPDPTVPMIPAETMRDFRAGMHPERDSVQSRDGAGVLTGNRQTKLRQ